LERFFPDQFYIAVELFNKEHFYEQHDVFEELWLKSSLHDIKKILYQGILNIGVGFYHFTLRNVQDKKDHLKGCIKQLEKGMQRIKTFLQKLEWASLPSDIIIFQRNWISKLLQETERWYGWLTIATVQKNLEDYPPFPKIHLDPFLKN
jgi:hypothetical protein